jgi:hypothetical protein
MKVDANAAHEEPVLVCLVSENNAGRKEEEARARRIYAQADQIEELADGYAFRIPAPDALLGTIADHLAFERYCCPFITFELDFAPDQGPLSLRMRGPAAFKEFLREGFETDLGIDAAVVSEFQAR